MKKLYKPIPILLALVMACLIGFTQVEPMPISSSDKKAVKLWQEAMLKFDDVEMSQAVNLLKQAVNADPNFFMANYQLAMVYKYFDNQEEYSKYLSQAINSKTKLTEGEAILKEALTRMQENPNAPVYDVADKLIDRYPHAKTPYYFKIMNLMMDKKNEEIIKLCDQLLRFTDTPGSVYNTKGYAYLALKDYDAALDAFNKYIELQPNHPNPYDSKGDYYMDRNQYTNAYESFIKAHEINDKWSYEKAMKAKKMAEWAKGPTNIETPDLKGAWLLVKIKMVSNGQVDFEIPGNVTGSQVKLWSDEYFSATGKFHIEDNDSDMDNFAGGSYEIAGNHYQEMIIYHASDEIVGSQANMIMELKGDSLIQTWPVTESGEIDWDNYSQETYVKLD